MTEGVFNILIFLISVFAFILFLQLLQLILDKYYLNKGKLKKNPKNPILEPQNDYHWESEAVFNPGAWFDGQKVHLIYRALGGDGVSRLGYAESDDGINFKRLPFPIYDGGTNLETHKPHTSPARFSYDKNLWASGGGWGGSEDPRIVSIEEKIYVTFNVFNGWYSMRVAMLSIPEKDFKEGRWSWTFNFLSPPGRHKNWVLFPEKINGKFALFHNLYHENPRKVQVEYFDEIELPDHLPHFESPDPQVIGDRQTAWHNRTRSAGAPPIKTPFGWLLIYHAMDPKDPYKYKAGAMLLDLDDPSKVLYRSQVPILEPKEWYENDWKPGIIYASGAVVKGDTLYIYYGGGDKRVNVATVPFSKFLTELTDKKNKI